MRNEAELLSDWPTVVESSSLELRLSISVLHWEPNTWKREISGGKEKKKQETWSLETIQIWGVLQAETYSHLECGERGSTARLVV